jgi:LacI family transcriptional regulator
VISDEFLPRLMPSLATLAQQGTEIRVIDVHRSFAQIRALLDQSRPVGLITEWLPGTTEKLLEREPRNRHYMEIWQEPSAALCDWLQRLPKPVGIFAAHDPLGRLVCEAGREVGIPIPEEMAVLGANNDELVCALSHPPLSSVVIPWDRIGSAVGEWIDALGKKQRRAMKPLLFLPGGVSQRQSTTLLAVEDDQLRRALQYLREKFEEGISIGMMCRDLRLSRRSVERRFKEHLRVTPLDMLNRMRVDRAKTMLVATNRSISMIGEKCGFANQERFAVVFRRHVKLSPSQFRKISRGAKGI